MVTATMGALMVVVRPWSGELPTMLYSHIWCGAPLLSTPWASKCPVKFTRVSTPCGNPCGVGKFPLLLTPPALLLCNGFPIPSRKFVGSSSFSTASNGKLANTITSNQRTNCAATENTFERMGFPLVLIWASSLWGPPKEKSGSNEGAGRWEIQFCAGTVSGTHSGCQERKGPEPATSGHFEPLAADSC